MIIEYFEGWRANYLASPLPPCNSPDGLLSLCLMGHCFEVNRRGCTRGQLIEPAIPDGQAGEPRLDAAPLHEQSFSLSPVAPRGVLSIRCGPSSRRLWLPSWP